MTNNAQPCDPSQVNVIIAEDSEDLMKDIKLSLIWFVGIDADKIKGFVELDECFSAYRRWA